MTTQYTSLLGLALPVTGELSGSWGDVVNDSITGLLDSAVSGATTLSADADVTLTTTDGAANQARQAILLWTATGTVTRNITAPARSKAYLVVNKTGGTQSIVIRGAGPTTGVTVLAGTKTLVVWDGADFVKVASSVVSLTTDVSGVLPEANGGTGESTYTDGQLLIGNSSGGLTKATITAGANIAVTNGNGSISIAATGDVVGPASSTDGGMAAFNGITGKLLKQAVAGTDYVSPAGVETITGTKTFSGTSSTLALILNDAAEVVTVSATAATGTINFDVTTQSVLYYTTSASGNWTLNVRGSAGTSLDTLMATGQSVTIAFLVTNGATAYYQSAFQIDGSSVTPKWQGGTAPTTGNASSIDVYVVTIIKTGAATFTALASQTRFA